jgi:large subunit ribosomal protein L15
MKLNDIKPNRGATRTRKRIGRGPGSGLGKTAGRGEKGQKSRSGYSHKRGFEGGQMPLQRRIPKRGFKNPFRKEFAIINLERLSSWDVDEIKINDYREFGFVKDYKDGIKVLGDGELSRAMTVHAHKFSKSAREKIEKAGGTCVIVEA